MMVIDHLNLTGATPLLAPEFIDMTKPIPVALGRDSLRRGGK
jgi:hypothetical protein